MSDTGTSTAPASTVRAGLEPWQQAALARLREPFADHQVSLLPKQVRRDDKERFNCVAGVGRKVSTDGRYCGGYHALSVHLDYVGHAALTDRLLDADPLWQWEPVAWAADGTPAFDRNGGMWIRLTVAGVTRLGYGDAQGKTGPNATKEAIGDALRNAGMRFGAALDLWHRGDLHDAAEQQGTEANPAPVGPPVSQVAPAPKPGGSGPQAGAQDRTGPDLEAQARWRRRVLAIESLPPLREAYKQARQEGVLGWPVDGMAGESFADLLQRLSATLPEEAPVEETPMWAAKVTEADAWATPEVPS